MAEADNINKTGGEAGHDKPEPGVPKKMEDILLPKKEGVVPATATRVNAGVLLEQEQTATLKKPPEQKAEPPPPAPKKEEQLVQPLETYRGAIEQAVQRQNVSVVSIAAAEAKRRAETPSSAPSSTSGTRQAAGHDLGFTIAALSGGALLIAGAAVVLAFIFWRPQATAPVISVPSSPFIEVDDVQILAIPAVQWQRNTILGATDAIRQSIELSLGLMARLYLAQATSSGALPPPASAQEFLGAVAPNIPGEFLRSLSGQYLLGVHSFDGNQAFLILEVEDYEAAYAGMLDWELAMPNELAPLFSRTPRPRIPEENVTPPETTPILPSGGSGTSTASTSSPQTSTSTTQTEELPDFFRTRFVDKIVENHDARVIQDENGDLLLLWTFLDRKILVITTNEYTLREIISRRARPPVIPL